MGILQESNGRPSVEERRPLGKVRLDGLGTYRWVTILTFAEGESVRSTERPVSVGELKSKDPHSKDTESLTTLCPVKGFIKVVRGPVSWESGIDPHPHL